MEKTAENDNLKMIEDGKDVLVDATSDACWILEENMPHTEEDEKISESDRWYIERLNEQLLEKMDSERNLEEILREIVLELEKEWNGLDREEKNKLGYTPSASIGLVRFDENRIDYFIVGGSSLIISNSVMNKVDSETTAGLSMDEKRKLDELKDKVGLTHQEAIEELRSYNKEKGKEGSAGFLRFDEEDVFLGKTGFFNKDEFDELMLFNLGYRKIVEEYGLFESWKKIVGSSKEELKGTLEKLRDLEEEDPNLKKYPRLKKHVDIGVVSIEL